VPSVLMLAGRVKRPATTPGSRSFASDLMVASAASRLASSYSVAVNAGPATSPTLCWPHRATFRLSQRLRLFPRRCCSGQLLVRTRAVGATSWCAPAMAAIPAVRAFVLCFDALRTLALT
jgi:hypothetical protein